MTSMKDSDANLYTLGNAQKFGWSSVSGLLNAERVTYLERYLTGKRILDAGCGGGAFVEFLAAKGFEVTGVDKFEQFLDIARQQQPHGNYLCSDLTDLPFADKTFECTYCYDVLEHIDDIKAIRELARVTSQRLIITVPKEDEVMTKYNLTFLHYQDKTHLRNYTESSLDALSSIIKPQRIKIFPELPVALKPILTDFVQYPKFYRLLLKVMLKPLPFPQIYTGLVAIIDL